MANVTIAAGSVYMGNHPRVAGWLYVYSVSDFWLENYRSPLTAQSPHNGGGVPYLRIPLTGVSSDPTRYDFGQFILPSTTDAIINAAGARWGMFIFSDDDTPRLITHVANLESFWLPPSPSLTNLQDIAGTNVTQMAPVTLGDAFVSGTLYATNAVFSGTVTGLNFIGSGAGLTGIPAGAGGVLNTGTTTIGADTDADGNGIVSLQTRAIERLAIANNGAVTIAQTLGVTGLSTFTGGASVPGAKQISWTTANVAAPSASDNTTGSRILLYAPAAPDHIGMGIESGAGWFNAGTSNAWKWYFAAVLKHTLDTNGLVLQASSLNAKAVLQADSTTRGFLPPRMTTVQRDAITSPPEGLIIHNLTTNQSEFYNGTAWTSSGGGGGVSAFNSRTGAVVPATNDYTWAQINKATSSIADIATRSASDFNAGTLPDARFPATLPAISGVNLTALNASNLTTGTVPAARLPTPFPVTIIDGNPTVQFSIAGNEVWEIGGTYVRPYTDGFMSLGDSSHRLQEIYVNEALGVRLTSSGANITKLIAGTGAPEGVRTADIGSIYSDRTSGNVWKKKTGAGNTGWLELGNSAKVYRALLTQSGGADPTAIVLENSLGGTVVWAYVNSGEYTATLTGAFTASKTFVVMGSSFQMPNGTVTTFRSQWASANAITLYTHSLDVPGASVALTDSLLGDTEITILVYP